MPETMRLLVFKETRARLPIGRIRRLFDAVVRREGPAGTIGQVNLILCTDSRIRSLNRRFREIDRATDVLSFNLDSSGGVDQVFGEIYISAPYTRRQARRSGHGLLDEYLLLFCHGLLHLFGHDHDTMKRERTMFDLQMRYLNALRRKG
jgi:probable rRNA maturation factor